MSRDVGDNLPMSVTGRSRERFDKAIGLLNHDKADAMHIDGNKLMFYWAEPNDPSIVTEVYELPRDSAAMANIAWSWLESLPADAWDEETDPDIWHEKGWKVYTEFWGHNEGDWRIFVTVEPYTVWLGK